MENKRNIANPALRFLAFLIDYFLGWSLGFLVIFWISQENSLQGILDSLLNGVILFIFAWFLVSFVNAFLISKFGGTVGKLLTGIRITNQEGKNLSFWRALFRLTIGYAVSGALLWLGFIWILIDKETRQAWHDQIIGSFVVTANEGLWILGTAAAIALFAFNIFLGVSSFNSFATNQGVYRVIFEDIKSEVEKSLEPEVEKTLPEDFKEASETEII